LAKKKIYEAYGAYAADEGLVFRKPKNFNRKRKTRIFFIILLALLLTAALAFGVYKLFFGPEKYDDRDAFYFTSNILSEEGGKFKAVGSIDFDIYNYADIRTSKVKIEGFDIKVSANGKNITKKADMKVGERAMDARVPSACNVNIELPREYHDKLIEVEVTSKPNNVVLKAQFEYEPEYGYKVKDDGVCVEVILFANKDVTLDLEWDGEALIADSTNPYIQSAGLDKTKCSVSLAGGMSTSIYFFKADPKEEFDNMTDALRLSYNDEQAGAKQSVPNEEKEAEKDE